MKIAQVCPYDFDRHGGVKTHILQLSESLRNLGHEVVIIGPRSKKSIVHVDDCLQKFGNNLSLGFGGTKIDINICLGGEWRRLKTFLRQEQFDVIHYHTIWNPFLAFQILYLSISKNVATFHDTPNDSLLGKFLGRFVMPFFARLIFIKLQGIVSVSSTQSKLISRFSKRKINIIPNGITSPETSPKKLPQYSDQQLSLLFLGRLEPRKGLLDALQAFNNIGNSLNCRLLIAGEGNQRIEAEDYVRKQEIKNVIFLGSVSDEEKWNLLVTADIFIACALYGESFGIVLLEAMAAGVPIVGYANEGYKNVLIEEQLNHFARPGDTQALCLNMMNLVKDENKRKKLIDVGLAHVQDYKWNILTQRIYEIYEHTGART